MRHHIRIDDRKFLKSCVRAWAEQGNINHPAYGTWTASYYGKMKAERFREVFELWEVNLRKYLNESRASLWKF